MPRSNGTYTLPAGNPVVTNTSITSNWANTTLPDIGTEITNSIPRDGQAPPTANLPMNGYRHTNAGNGVASTDYAAYGQLTTAISALLSSLAAAGGAALIGNTPLSVITATTVQAAIDQLATYAGSYLINTSYSTTTTLPATSAGRLITLTGSSAYNVTLPLLSSVSSGAKVTIICKNTAGVTILRQSSDQIAPASGAAINSIALGVGDTASFTKADSFWSLTDGSVTEKYADAFSSTLSTSLFQKIANSAIIQGGVASATSGGSTLTFPTPFPSTCLAIVPVINNAGAASAILSANVNSRFSANLYVNTGGGVQCYWIAIGF